MPPSTLLAASLEEDRTSLPLKCAGAVLGKFHIDGVETDAPAGEWMFEGSDDPRVEEDLVRDTATAKWAELEVPAEAVHGLKAGQAVSAGRVTWDGANPFNALVLLEHPPAYMRVSWVYSGGGSADSLANVRGSKRGPG